jgi:hypothetical protein
MLFPKKPMAVEQREEYYWSADAESMLASAMHRRVHWKVWLVDPGELKGLSAVGEDGRATAGVCNRC